MSLPLPTLVFPKEAVPSSQAQGASSGGQEAPGGHETHSGSEVGQVQSVAGCHPGSCFLAAASVVAVAATPCSLIYTISYCPDPAQGRWAQALWPGTDVLEVKQSGSPGLLWATEQPAFLGLTTFPNLVLQVRAVMW